MKHMAQESMLRSIRILDVNTLSNICRDIQLIRRIKCVLRFGQKTKQETNDISCNARGFFFTRRLKIFGADFL